MSSVQENFSINPEPNEIPVAEIRGINQSGLTSCLELQANIGGQDR